MLKSFCALTTSLRITFIKSNDDLILDQIPVLEHGVGVYENIQFNMYDVTHWSLVWMFTVPGSYAAGLPSQFLGCHKWITGMEQGALFSCSILTVVSRKVKKWNSRKGHSFQINENFSQGKEIINGLSIHYSSISTKEGEWGGYLLPVFIKMSKKEVWTKLRSFLERVEEYK